MKKKKGKAYRPQVIPEKKPREPFVLNTMEKILLGMFGLSVLATLMAFLLWQEIISYVLLGNYLFLGLIMIVRPLLFVNIMRKSREAHDDQYKNREKFVFIALRVAGAALIGFGVFFGYQLFAQ